jgi:hypothetical protein
MTPQEIYLERGYIVLGWFDGDCLVGSTIDSGKAILDNPDALCDVPLKVIAQTDYDDWLAQSILVGDSHAVRARYCRFPRYYRVVAE